MKITIRPADLDADRLQMIQLFRQHLNADFDERRFNWMYLGGPHGKAVAWVSTTDENKELMGAATAFPRLLRADGKETQGYVLGDFCIHPSARTLGPALQLQRACLEGISARLGTLWYDFPSDAMTAVYRRLGINSPARLVRLSKPLRADRALATKFKSRAVKSLMGVAANTALRASDSIRRRGGASQITLHQGPCGEEFSRLAQQTQNPREICVLNTAGYLNWRFLSHPFQQFDILTACEGDALCGYVVLAREGDDARIYSLRSLDDETARDLILSAIDAMRSVRVVTISASIIDEDPRTRIFKKLGFRPRESRPVVFPEPAASRVESKDKRKNHWHLMDGDRDG